MRTWLVWLFLIVAIVITSLAGIMALGTFLRAQTICPDFFDCEDARDSSIAFSAVAVGGALVVALAWWRLGSRPKRVDLR